MGVFDQANSDALKEMDGETPEAESTETEVETPEGGTQENQPIDLDKVEKFMFEGKEWSPKDFRAAYMMQADYTRKTQMLSEERKKFQEEQKFVDNIEYDLEKVLQNPALASQFKQIYPQKFHKLLDKIVPATSQTQTNQPQVDPAFMKRIEQLEKEREVRIAQDKEREVAKIEAQLDPLFDKMLKKFNFADEEAVIARANSVLDHAEKSGDQIQFSDKAWETLFKESHERNQKRAQSLLKEQQHANARGKDAASGGAIPGLAPKTPRTISEAGELAKQALMRS